LFSGLSEYHIVLFVVNESVVCFVAGEPPHNAGWFVATTRAPTTGTRPVRFEVNITLRKSPPGCPEMLQTVEVFVALEAIECM